MKFTRKIGMMVVAIMLVAICSGFADAKTNKKFFDALNNGDEKTVETMLKKDKSLANIETDFSRKPLMIAARRDNRKIAEILIANGADVNARDQSGWTVLTYASQYGNIEIIKLFLEKGADATIKNGYGETAFMIASKKGYKDIEELLISSLPPEQKAAIEKERQEKEELAKKEAEEKAKKEAEAKKRYRAEDFEYGITKDGRGIRIYDLKKYAEDVQITIPATIEGFPVTEVILADWGWHAVLIGFEKPSNITLIQFRGTVDCDLNLPNCKFLDFDECHFNNPVLTVLKNWNNVPLGFSETNIEKIVVQEGVAILDNMNIFGFGLTPQGFKDCKKLKTLVLPSTLKAIRRSTCFEGCSSLSEIIIPNKIGRVEFASGFDDVVFRRCPQIPVAIQARLRQIGYEGRF